MHAPEVSIYTVTLFLFWPAYPRFVFLHVTKQSCSITHPKHVFQLISALLIEVLTWPHIHFISTSNQSIIITFYHVHSVPVYRTGGKFRAIPDFALFRKFRGY